MKNIYLQIPELYRIQSPLVLATVTGTRGSTPQKPGSSALFNRNGLALGTVGGGVVEGKIQKIAKEAIITGYSGLYQFNLDNDISKLEEAICGGQINILVDARPDNYMGVFEQVKKSVTDRIPGVLLTMITRFKEEKVHIDRYWMSNEYKPSIPVEFMKKLEPVVAEILSSGRSSECRLMDIANPGEEAASTFFLEPVFPMKKLIIGGAGHIGKALAHLGNLLDFEVTVIDDREEFANMKNIPDASHIIVGEIGQALENYRKGPDTYVVIVTRGHRDDALALRPCIGSGVAYTGMIGSKKKIESIRSSFLENGWATTDQWDQIYAPVGLEIRSQTVEEIAVSIAAQLVLVRNSRKG